MEKPQQREIPFFARIWRNALNCNIFSMIVLFRYQTVLCVILDDLT